LPLVDVIAGEEERSKETNKIHEEERQKIREAEKRAHDAADRPNGKKA